MDPALAIAERYLRDSDERAEVQLDPHVQQTVGDERVVHGQQQYRGLSLYPHSFLLHVDGDRVERRSGDALIDCDGVSVVPWLSAEAAVGKAAAHVRSGETSEACIANHEPLFEDRKYKPKLVAAFPMPNRPTVFSKGPFSDSPTANLVLFSRTTPPVVAWLITLSVERVAEFTIVVRATEENPGEILYCVAEAASAICTASVYLFNPGEGGPVAMTFPRSRNDYPASIRPNLDFADWVEKNVTHGNNVTTLFNNGNRFARATTTAAGLTFTAPKDSIEEQLLNAFFLCNYLHDLFSLLGFGEADGNFQQINPSKKGFGGDRLIVNVLPNAHGTANMNAQNDGKPAKMLLGVFKNGMPTAYDADIVIHEYAHGVSQRLVGGQLKKTALIEPQSMAMGEGWSDYFAVTIQNFHRANPIFTFAAWSSRNPNGTRPHRYDDFRATFADLGNGAFHEQHGAGSVFAAALIEMQNRLVQLLGRDAGNVLGWKSVIASMKMLTANPNFLQGRERVIEAAKKLAPAANVEPAIRESFAKFGMGRNAASNGTSLAGNRADRTA